MFHPAKVSYSKDTHDLIKRKFATSCGTEYFLHKTLNISVLMEEQKMTIFQRDKLKYYLRNGDPLPLPKFYPPKMTTQQQYEHQLASQIIMRANSARKRTLNEIKASGAFQQEK